jgi:hypothetical protein
VVDEPDQQGRLEPTVAAGATSPAAGDVISQLERLASLLQQGVLTPEEFATQKSRVLQT